MYRAILIEFIYSGVGDINIYYKIDNASIINDFYSDYFSSRKVDKITVISLNVNSFRTEGWTVKNDMVRDFILGADTDIVTIKEININ